MEFNVNPVTPAEEPVFNVDPGTQAPNISADTVEKRSFKFKYGLEGILPKTKDEIFQGLTNGEEPQLREEAASEIDVRKQKATESTITQLVANKGGPLSPDETKDITDIIQKMNIRTDPNTVLEDGFGKNLLAELDKNAAGKTDNLYNDAKKENAEEVAGMSSKASSLVAKRMAAETILEDLNDEVANQGWVPYLADQAKTLVPGYQDIKLRGYAPGVSQLAGLGLGTNLEEQRKALQRLPVDEFASKLKEISSNIRKDNPALAVQFVQAVIGQSTNEIALNNLTTALDVSSIPGTKLITKGVKSVLMTDAEKAIKDVAKVANDPNMSKSSILSAAGDLKESAITKVTADLTAEAAGDPQSTKRGIEALSSAFRTDEALILEGPSTKGGRELSNRIVEQSQKLVGDLFKTVQEVSKVNRLPEVMANEATVRAIQEETKDLYTGLKNSVLDVSAPYKEPLANTYLVDLNLGKNDGTYFPNRNVAENFIKFHGLSDATINEGTDAARTKSAVKEAQLRKDLKDIEATLPKIEERLKNANLSPEARAKDEENLRFLTEEARPQKLQELTGLTTKQTATVEQQGLGYYVKVTKPINETSDVIRDALAQTSNTQLPDGLLAKFMNGIPGVGKFRTPEEVLSVAERQNRLTATNSPSEYFRLLVENTGEIKKLQAGRFSKGRKRWEEWQRVVKNADELIDPETKLKGYSFKSPADLEVYYQQTMKRLPDEQEVAAYFEFKRIMEVDRVFRNLAEHRNQQRVGSETHKIISVDLEGKKIESPEFSGVIKKELPGGDDNIAVMGDRIGEEKVYTRSKMDSKLVKELDEAIAKGEYKAIEFWNPELRPLQGFGSIGDTRIRYVLTKTAETRELDWNQVPRRGGGHLEYDYDNYIKQAKIHYDDAGKRYWYEGDTTLMPIQIRKMGQDVAGHLEEVRRLLKAKDDEAARLYSNKNLHIDWDTVDGWFKPGKNAEGNNVPARLSLDQKIQVVPKGKQIIDIDKDLERLYSINKSDPNFKNGTKSGSLARQNQVQYTGQRDSGDLFTLEDVGTKNNPLYKVAQADTIDPITTMNRGLSRIAKTNFMDDYKTMSVEHWLRQASKYLDATDSEIKYSPYYYFHEGRFKTGTDPQIIARLEAAKFHMQQLVGTPSDTDAYLHSAGQQMADSLYGKFGPKAIALTPTWALPILKDPFSFIRSVTFNAKLGLFNIPQFIVQAGNYSNILGIAGLKYAGPGTIGAQLHFWSSVNSNPAIIKALDEKASMFRLPGASNWKPGEFTEAWNELRKTGFGNVGSEYAMLDSPTSNKVIGDGIDNFLEMGQFFFKQGERNAKYGAWYTAFKEFRDVNPIGRLTEADRAKILQRADLLNVNMTRASSSQLHTGVWSVPTQFYTYQIRLMELFFGSRLTATERARMFTTNALLYGVPMATGLTGLPAAGPIREYAMENGYTVGENFFSTMLFEGLPSAIGGVITGGGDPKKGTYFDFADRFGTKGVEFVGGLNRSDKSYMDIIGGPAYSLIKGTLQQSDGFRTAMLAMAKGDPDTFPMTTEDVVDVFKEITSVNTAWRTLAAINAGRWLSKKDAYLADTTAGQALFSAATGLKNQEITDVQTMTNSLKSQKDMETEIEKRFEQEFTRGMLAQKDNNPEMAKKFFTRAVAFLELGQYPEARRLDLVGKAMRNNQSIVDKVNFDFYIKKAPDAQKDVRQKAMQNKLINKENN